MSDTFDLWRKLIEGRSPTLDKGKVKVVNRSCGGILQAHTCIEHDVCKRHYILDQLKVEVWCRRCGNAGGNTGAHILSVCLSR